MSVFRELRFEGHSDDTFGEYGWFREDYDCCASGAMIVFKVTDPRGNGLHVCGQYSGKQWPDAMPGCWLVGIQQLEEDVPLPNWPMRWEMSDAGYSPTLFVSVPIGSKMVCLNNGKEYR